jgi:hypothetical protein
MVPLRRIAGTITAVVFALSWSGVPAADATTKLIWGPNTMPDGASAFPLYRQLGVDVLQRQLNWAATAPSRPTRPADPQDPAYRWPAALDVAAAEAQRSGIRLALQVTGSPGWANGGRVPAAAPRRPQDYASFLRAAARRYPRVRHWMIWGEPTRPGNFLPMSASSPTGTRRYARLLDTAYVALKRASRRNVVIGGMTWTLGIVAPPTYVRWLRLPNGKPPRLDMWGHNPFSRRRPRLADRPYSRGVRDFNDIDTLSREVARAYRSRAKRPRLWLSEWTISSDRANRAYDFFVSREEQAGWITDAYRAVDGAPYVAGLGWFSLLDEAPAGPNTLTTGLMTADGQPKAAFAAYARAR